VHWADVVPVAVLGGIGYTVSLRRRPAPGNERPKVLRWTIVRPRFPS